MGAYDISEPALHACRWEVIGGGSPMERAFFDYGLFVGGQDDNVSGNGGGGRRQGWAGLCLSLVGFWRPLLFRLVSFFLFVSFLFPFRYPIPLRYPNQVLVLFLKRKVVILCDRKLQGLRPWILTAPSV